jgi:hypothetical protein
VDGVVDLSIRAADRRKGIGHRNNPLSEAGAAAALSTIRSPLVDKLWKSLPASGPFGVNEH